ncbi:agmatinase [Prochlorococcus sp. MIT 1223]|uniref:agmatinase n=1 Tax=Prochlorococcus sp. MIT 1223 TaxID=3096217 RepID=UPI002A74A2B7|nr:agmatinase [Prochlorococcus sp. MIT 1223]
MKKAKYSENIYFNSEGTIFMGAERESQNCEIAIFGVPYDGTTSFRPGSRFGPAAIRDVSNGIETFCPQFKLDIAELKFADLGSLEIPYGDPEPVIELVRQATGKIVSQGHKPLILGGEHSISSGAINATVEHHNNLIVIQLDAHADLREEWLGSKYNHACAMSRCLDVLPSKQLFQIGIRSGSREEFQKLAESNRLIPFIKGTQAHNLKEKLKPFIGTPIYLSIDLDWFDPSVLPGTGTPEPGGYLWDDFAAVIDVLKEHNIVAADIVELSPQLDPFGMSSIFAAKVTRSILILLSSRIPAKTQ